MIRRLDPEVQILAGISLTLEVDYTHSDAAWVGSPFGWIRTRPSRQRGAIGEKLVAGWLAARGFNVTRAGNSDADRIIESKLAEIKFSTLWEHGTYTFQQLRDQRYDLAICLGVSPFDAHCWVFEKREILKYWRETGEFSSQHGGASGIDTAWVTIDPASPGAWLRRHGGTLREGVAVISRLTGFTPPGPEGDQSGRAA